MQIAPRITITIAMTMAVTGLRINTSAIIISYGCFCSFAFLDNSCLCWASKASCSLPYAIFTITTNSTGTINIAMDEAATIPPSTVTPIVLRATAPAPVASTSGITPKINAMEVIIIGRNLSFTASRVDCIRSSPLSTGL